MIFAGWVCANASDETSPRCGTYNGEEKARRDTCRKCGGPRQAPEGMSREDLFRLCAMMIAERNQATEMLTACQEKLAAYIEVARCAKALLGALEKRAETTEGDYLHDPDSYSVVEKWEGACSSALRRLEEGAGSAALLTPPTSC